MNHYPCVFWSPCGFGRDCMSKKKHGNATNVARRSQLWRDPIAASFSALQQRIVVTGSTHILSNLNLLLLLLAIYEFIYFGFHWLVVISTVHNVILRHFSPYYICSMILFFFFILFYLMNKFKLKKTFGKKKKKKLINNIGCAFFFSCKGPWRAIHNNWLATWSSCHWEGVLCTGQVKKIQSLLWP